MDLQDKSKRLLLVTLFVIGVNILTQGSIAFAASKDKPTNPSINFKLFPSNYFTSYDVSASLTGSDSRGMQLAGSIKEKTLPKANFMGSFAIPITVETEFTAFGVGFGLAIVTSHYNSVVNNRRFLGVSGDITTIKATTTPIPVTAKIGESGVTGTYIDKRNFKTKLSWQLADGFNGKAKLILLNETKKPSGVLDNRFKTTYLIHPNGTRESVELETYNDTIKLTVTLMGKY